MKRRVTDREQERALHLISLRHMRRNHAELIDIRRMQLSLWVWRQMREHPEYRSPRCFSIHSFPGLYENYQKFVYIHETAGNA